MHVIYLLNHNKTLSLLCSTQATWSTSTSRTKKKLSIRLSTVFWEIQESYLYSLKITKLIGDSDILAYFWSSLNTFKDLKEQSIEV